MKMSLKHINYVLFWASALLYPASALRMDARDRQAPGAPRPRRGRTFARTSRSREDSPVVEPSTWMPPYSRESGSGSGSGSFVTAQDSDDTFEDLDLEYDEE